MAFNIEQMKADGVSPHLIELASMEQETFLLLIARRLEHDKLFQQFMGENAGSIEAMYPYAVAAGLMSENDRKWLIDEENPYIAIISFTINFEWSGTNPEPITVNEGESLTLPGSNDMGWYTEDTHTNLVGYGESSYTPTESLTLYGNPVALI